jgi:alkanesulfonate monooxygenase SsuD/methylene tetrahydromethanopterin reductase-like flavin-dependent oxidoreductase (luciferase family)
MFVQKGISLTDEQADDILASPQGHQIAEMMRYSAVGTPDAVKEYLDSFAVHADADELMVAPASPGIDARLRSLDLLADVSQLVPA